MKQLLGAILLFLLVGCGQQAAVPTMSLPSTPFATQTEVVAVQIATGTSQATATPAPSATPLPSATMAPSATPQPSATTPPATATATVVPPTATAIPPSATTVPPTAVPPTTTAAAPTGFICARPPGDNRTTTVRNHTISYRTLVMLDNAQALYGGPGSTRLLIQGSYDTSTGASFGTHDGGGAVDIWMVYPNDTSRLLPDIDRMVIALRQSGFAAWFRPKDMLYEGMYAHIHAIAIGDPDLSPAAREQLDGPHGYFAGNNGLPDAGYAGPDPYGGPVWCDWFADYGHRIARAPAPTVTAAAPVAVACQAPTDDYTRVTLGDGTVSRRTAGMLRTAQALYGGPGNLLWVTQGSYTGATAGSFGTHDGGGAVDISIRHPQSYEFLYNETGRMVTALRQAGFAAWYRSEIEGYTPHIHAIAIGDAELSQAATDQLTGDQGYFRGRNGLPDERAAPDPHGGPIVCDWMVALGYGDWR